jgi:hypothetical protein
MVWPFLCVAAGVTILAVLYSQRRQRVAMPPVLHHQGKLVKEAARAIGLKPNELKQLKILAEQVDAENPLLLLMCPSILATAIKQNANPRLDRQILAGLVTRMKPAPEGKPAPGKPSPEDKSATAKKG